MTTLAYMREILGGWARCVDALKEQRGGRGELGEFLAICERWTRIAGLLEKGVLEHCTIVAKRS